VLRNFVPERMIRETGTMMRANIDDGDIFIGEFEGDAICSVQSSFVTVGNYPGIEARVHGSEGALIVRLVEEFGVMETLKGANLDAVEFVDVEVPQRLFPPGADVHEPWPTLYYSNLTANFVDEILDGGDKNEGNLGDAAWVQEVINAVERSHHDRGWVSLPLPR
jgi:predicted dehydrogenase